MPKNSKIELATGAEDIVLSLQPASRGKGASSVTQKRSQVESAVTAGATVGDIIGRFGASHNGLRTVARHTRFGRYVIDGIKADAKTHLSPDADARLARQLERISPKTKIIEIIPRNARMSVGQICANTGFSLASVIQHVNHLIINRLAKLDGHASTVVTIPKSGMAPSATDEPVSPTPEAVDLTSPLPERVPTTVHRIIRDTELARRVKALHRYKCQICGHTIQLPDGSFYAEAHHIQPLGKPHNGPDERGNILCLCPNHHAELDYGSRRLALPELTVVAGHVVEPRYLDYHNQKIFDVTR